MEQENKDQEAAPSNGALAKWAVWVAVMAILGGLLYTCGAPAHPASAPAAKTEAGEEPAPSVASEAGAQEGGEAASQESAPQETEGQAAQDDADRPEPEESAERQAVIEAAQRAAEEHNAKTGGGEESAASEERPSAAQEPPSKEIEAAAADLKDALSRLADGKGLVFEEVPLPKEMASGNGEGYKLTFKNSIGFPSGSSNPDEKLRAWSKQIALAVSKYPNARVIVDGHTDASGNDAINVPLSAKRAEAVKALLVANGVAADGVTAKGHGSADPIGDNATEEGKLANRRVELTAYLM